jgi:hypothetical protein
VAANIRRFEDRDVDPVVGLSLRAWAPVFTTLTLRVGTALTEFARPDQGRRDAGAASRNVPEAAPGRTSELVHAGDSAPRFGRTVRG